MADENKKKTTVKKNTNTTSKKVQPKKSTTTLATKKNPTPSKSSSSVRKKNTTSKAKTSTNKVSGTPNSKTSNSEKGEKPKTVEPKKTTTKKKTTTVKTKTNSVKKKTTAKTSNTVTKETPKKKVSPIKEKTTTNVKQTAKPKSTEVKKKIEGRPVSSKKKPEEKTKINIKEFIQYEKIVKYIKDFFKKIIEFIKNKQEKLKKNINDKNVENLDKSTPKIKIEKEKIVNKKLQTIEIVGGSILFIILLIVFINVPLGSSIYKSGASNKKVDVPRFMKLKEECCAFTATFSSFRSVHSLKHDLDKIISGYEVLNCDNKTFYYNSKENYTVTDFVVRNGKILNEVYISYGAGNSCNIDTRFKKLELLPNDFSIEDAKKDGNFVIVNDKVYNKEAYDNFMNSVNTGVHTTLRIVTLSKEGDVIITDLEHLKDGKFMVYYDNTRDRLSNNHNSITAYKFEHIKLLKNKLYVYNGDKLVIKDAKKFETYYLLTLPEN